MKDKKYKWNIESVYESQKDWDKDLKKVFKKAFEFKEYEKINLLEKDFLYEALRDSFAINRLAEKLFVYAKMRKDEDLRKEEGNILFQKTISTFSDISNKTAFFIPQLLKLNSKKVFEKIAKEKKLKKYSFYFKKLFREKKHVLSKEKEELIASFSEITSAPSEIFDMLTDADMNFGKIKNEKGDLEELTNETYRKFISSENRRVRKNAYDKLYEVYLSHLNTIATAYAFSLKNDKLKSKLRKYPSALSRGLSSDKVPEKVYRNLINAVKENLPTLHKYIALRKKSLGLKTLRPYDLYVPIIKHKEKTVKYDEGFALMEKALVPLGAEYTLNLKKSVKERWVDVYENKGKASGAYSFGSYDTYPFILLNYGDKLKDVFTLVHEMGHSMHSFFTRKSQDFIYGGHSIFTAETASTVNEILLTKYLLANAKNKKEKAYYLNLYLEGFRTTLIRQTMFAEFELITHENIEQDLMPTKENLTGIYRKLNAEYFGDGLIIDDKIAIEWARVPHFYRAFYVYKYATGYSAAVTIAKKILEEKNYYKKYIKFLSSGDSDDPINLLKIVDLDMEKPEPIKIALEEFDKGVEELGALL
jgi:oligoendopeptidase F